MKVVLSFMLFVAVFCCCKVFGKNSLVIDSESGLVSIDQNEIEIRPMLDVLSDEFEFNVAISDDIPEMLVLKNKLKLDRVPWPALLEIIMDELLFEVYECDGIIRFAYDGNLCSDTVLCTPRFEELTLRIDAANSKEIMKTMEGFSIGPKSAGFRFEYEIGVRGEVHLRASASDIRRFKRHLAGVQSMLMKKQAGGI